MRVEASAPGKLVVCGEYAVLEGAPALVLTVDARARVSLEGASDGAFGIAAPDVGAPDTRFDFDARGGVRWRDLDEARQERIALVARIIEVFGARQTPFHASLDTREFSLCGEKLGLGSSAALTVALAGALCARAQCGPPNIENLIALHRDWQGGGSGLDVAASCRGGLSIYRLRGDRPSIEHAEWPTSLYWCCVWSGTPADTGSQLRRFSDWRARAPDSYAEKMRELARCAENAAAASRGYQTADLLAAVAAYARRLREFDDAAGLGIFGVGHRALTGLAGRHGVIYKPCGAGGDIGLALSPDPQPLKDFRRELGSSGFHEIAPRRSDRGLQVVSNPVHSTREARDHAGRYVATAG
ncbi:MAG: mevalonate kinase family protein [Rhodanobacteraceae bacterium]